MFKIGTELEIYIKANGMEHADNIPAEMVEGGNFVIEDAPYGLHEFLEGKGLISDSDNSILNSIMETIREGFKNGETFGHFTINDEVWGSWGIHPAVAIWEIVSSDGFTFVATEDGCFVPKYEEGEDPDYDESEYFADLFLALEGDFVADGIPSPINAEQT